VYDLRFFAIGGKQATLAGIAHELAQTPGQHSVISSQQFAYFLIKRFNALARIIFPSPGKLMVEGQVNHDSTVTPERSWKILSQLGHFRPGIEKLIGMPVQFDAQPHIRRIKSQRPPPAYEVTQHCTEPESIVLTGEQKMGQKIHAASLPESHRPAVSWTA